LNSRWDRLPVEGLKGESKPHKAILVTQGISVEGDLLQ